MKFLHTADWHVGKTLKGRDRLEEQRAVLGEIVRIAEEHQVDAVLIAGDLYDSVAPSAQAQQRVVQTLLRLQQGGTEVIAIAGNHDHAPTFDAYRPLMGVAGITLVGGARPPDKGGLIRFRARTSGEDVQLAVLPFLTPRYAVKAAEIMINTPSENVRAYDDQIRRLVDALTSDFGGDTVNLAMSHLTCVGGLFGGGERAAQSIFEYSVAASIFPVSAHYVALGHLHRRQSLPAHCPVHYSGSPIAVDFGEQDNTSVVCLVEATPSTPARVTDIPVTSGRRLRTVRGTVAELEALASSFGEDYLRVWVREPARAGLREAVAGILPNALEVRIDPEFAAPVKAGRAEAADVMRTPGQLFADYCAAVSVADSRVAKLFADLHDEVVSAETAGQFREGSTTMRPVVLDMNGFAAFREPARVDFTDASFFALVGPTGSGKSTVIDAMTFALYGSVPRWGRRGMVSLALAPTTGRATVRLVFEAAGQRYVVARELRRIGSQVSQRAATLERITDPDGLAGPGEPTEVLAKERGVAEAVERLLGLSYDDFCQCVVLPQGQFAAFLHATPGDRQKILLRLLGAEHYQQMMTRANHRAGAAGQRADALSETVATFADATPEAQDAAQAAEKTLDVLNERVRLALPEIEAADRDLNAATAELERLERERATLAAIRVPADAAALDARLAGARVRVEQARAAETDAAGADAGARQALSGGPQRAPLELARQRRQERGRCAARRPSLEQDAERLVGVSRQADDAVAETEGGLERLRADRDQAARAAEAAGQTVRDLSTAHATLTAVTIPDGVNQLDERERTAAAATQQTRERLDAAEQADREARAAVDSAVSPGLLERAERDLGELRELAPAQAAAQAELTRAGAEREAADEALTAAESARRARQDELDEARRTHLAADLRTHLVAGRPCPVCDQSVATLPAPLDAAAIEAAQDRLGQAVAAAAAAQKRAAAAATAEVKAVSGTGALTGQRARHVTALAAMLSGPLAGANLTAVAEFLAEEGARSGNAGSSAAAGTARAASGAAMASMADALTQVTAALQARRELDAAVRTAAAGLDAARRRAQSARDALGAVQAEGAQARRDLHAARDRLVGLGAPAADDASLAAAWSALASWAAGQARERAAELAGGRAAAQAAAGKLQAAQERFAEAERSLTRLRTEAAQAARELQDARTRLTELAGRIGELDRLLGDAPDEADITAQLARRDELEAAAAAAEQRLLTARSGRGDAEKALADLERDESAARARLSAARDPLVALGAPALGDGGLLAAWQGLASWAAEAAVVRDAGIGPGREKVEATRSVVNELTARLRADLADAGVGLAPDAVPAAASRAVAAALERARAATLRIAERCAQAAGLAAKRDAAREEQNVAKMLGDLLRSDRFPRWLVTAAVDTLVEFASANLAGLSGGQFDLTHEDGEFYVIDHADADSQRSVRTLSGGETFQASLALALALSSQMSSLSAAGVARLDSIFLDEGFGTLDPETLDVVASTLETLAQDDRMVGVITHVAALAERVPVRFHVSRDARTSRVVREGAAL